MGTSCEPAVDARDGAGGPLLALALAFPTALTLAYFVLLAGAPRAAQQAVYAGGKVLQFGLPAAWWLLRSRPAAGPRRPGDGVAAGLALGAAAVAGGLALYRLGLVPHGVLTGGPAEAIRAKVAGLGVAGPGAYLALAAFYALVHSGAEEWYWRWFVHRSLVRHLGRGAATLASSAGFAAHHVVLLAVFFGWGSPFTWLLAAAVGVGGAGWAWLYGRSGSLLGPWLSHALVDAGLFWIGWDLLR